MLLQVDARKLQKAEAKLKEKLEKRSASDPRLRPAEMWALQIYRNSQDFEIC